MIVVSHEDDYFERTPIEKQRVCCNCRNRVLNASMADKCNIDGHRIGYVQCFTNWCLHWASDELKWKGGERMKMCENCKHWIQMKENEGKCVLYGLKYCAWTPADATCDEWEGDDE